MRLVFILLIFIPTSLFAQTTYYISSSEGNDSNTGTSISHSWKSLDKANSFKPSPGDKILFKRGDEWIGTLIPTGSGTSGSPITFGAYGIGEKPKIYGSEEIEGWTQHSGNIYKATFNTDINQLFINGKRAKLARHPNSGFFSTKSTNGTTSIESPSLNGGINYSGAKWHCRTLAWAIETKDVTSSSSTKLNLSSEPVYDIDVNDGFWLSNKLEFLDQAGEYYYDSKNNTVFLWMPDGGSPSNYEVRGSTINHGVKIRDKDYINIEDLEFLHYKDTGINTDHCSYLVIKGVKITSPDSYGIYLNHDNQGTYQNIIIDGANHVGMKSNTSNSSFVDNAITNTGLIEHLGLTGMGGILGGSAIYNFAGGYNTFRYNRIDKAAYNGIRWDTDNTIIDKNFITNTCLIKDDGGAIYTWASSSSSEGPAGSVVSNNIILHAQGTTEGGVLDRTYGYGIYMDNHAHDVNIIGNTVAHCGNATIYLHGNKNIIVDKNILMDARYIVYIQDEDGDNYVTNNILYALKRDFTDFADEILVGQRNGANGTYNNNIYVNHHKASSQFRDQKNYYDFNSWKEKTGQDSNSSFDSSNLDEKEIEKLFYNNTKQKKTFDFGSKVYKDIYGKSITGSITLDPYTSMILIGTIFDNNQSPIINNQTFEIQGNIQINNIIGQVSASNPNTDQSLAYSIIGGNTDNLFSIDSSSGDIIANTSTQITSNQSVNLSVRVTDNGSPALSSTATITINISGVNQIPDTTPTPDISKPSVTDFSIPATSSSLTISIENFSATDNTGISSYIVTENLSTPSVNDKNWMSSAPEYYTFSEEGSKNLYAWVKDAAGNVSSSVHATISITLLQLDTTKPNITDFTIPISSSSLTISIEYFLATDNTGISSYIVTENSNTPSVNDNNWMSSAPEYYTFSEEGSKNLYAWVKDAAGNISSSSNASVVITLPQLKSTISEYLFEESTGTTVIDSKGSVDGTMQNEELRVKGVRGNGIQLTGKGYINLGNSYLARVKEEVTLSAWIKPTSDGNYQGIIMHGGPNIDSFALYVKPNEKSIGFKTAGTTNQWTSTNASTLWDGKWHQLTATYDGNQKVIYIDGEKIFNIEATGTIESGEGYNCLIGKGRDNTEPDHNYCGLIDEVRIFNTAMKSSEVSDLYNQINNEITEVNHTPIISNQIFEITQTKYLNDFIGKVNASDPNSDQNVTFSITQGNEEGLFAINPNTGEITANKTITPSITKSYVLTIKVTDDNLTPLSATATITLNINAVEKNEEPVINDQSFITQGDIQLNGFIGQISASDPDTDQNLTYSIINGNDGSLFAIDSSNGQITANKSIINPSSDQTIVLTVKVTDNHNNPLSAEAQISIIIKAIEINKEPVIENQIFKIRKDQEIGNIIGQIQASDPNLGQELTYTILQGNDQNLFDIDPITGEIFTKEAININEDKEINLVIQATDNGIYPLSANGNVTINLILNGKVAKGEVTNNNPNQIVLEFNKQLKSLSLKNTQVNDDFTLNNSKSVLEVSVSGNTIYLDIDSDYQYDDDIIISYSKGSTPLYDDAGNEIDSFTDFEIQNNIKAIATSVDPIINESDSFEVSVYPNPSNGIITVKADNLVSDNCEVNFYSLSGSLVSQKLLYGSFGSIEERMNISHLNKGTYIVHFICETQTYQNKIIKM